MPLPREIREQLELKHAAEEEQAARDAMWAKVRMALGCVASSALGLFCMAWAFHTTDESLGRVLLSTGVIVGYAGVAICLLGGYTRGKDKGYW